MATKEPSLMHGRFHTLGLMRGAAAMTVMAYHAGRFAPYGYLAVDLFFVLSGFVLTQAYRMRLGGWRNFRDFAVARAIRLGPLMLAGAIIGLLINGGLLWTVLLVPSGDTVLYPEIIPLSSLLFEIAASLAFAGLFRFGIVAWATRELAFLARRRLSVIGRLVARAALRPAA
jgi:hypothetical protein